MAKIKKVEPAAEYPPEGGGDVTSGYGRKHRRGSDYSPVMDKASIEVVLDRMGIKK
jgi:hypothetical protein